MTDDTFKRLMRKSAMDAIDIVQDVDEQRGVMLTDEQVTSVMMGLYQNRVNRKLQIEYMKQSMQTPEDNRRGQF